MCVGSSTWATAETIRNPLIKGDSSLTRVSGSMVLAPFLAGVTVRDDAATDVTRTAARLLADLGATVDVRRDAVDVVLADRVRDEAAPRDCVWVCVTPFGATGPRANWRASDLGVMAASGNMFATGDPDRAPVRCAGAASRAHGAPEVAFAVVTALASGVRPADVDVSLQEVVLVANMGAAGRFFSSGNRG